ncbi:hypothetical protein UFOVP184_30 [uncultured Caudovirales phage]|uniref:Uncharacterized protein n=1 Tax=uncultured Caudovirales phage TaxID=2100421 RepID=A0A6J7WGL2_9CAUD|nr:hypothetical protein UFOVP184_30 [uncultured Caudovirales phage]
MVYYAYATKYEGATDTRGSRIVAKEVGTKGRAYRASYDYGFNNMDNHIRAAHLAHTYKHGEDLRMVFAKGLDGKGYLVFGVGGDK